MKILNLGFYLFFLLAPGWVEALAWPACYQRERFWTLADGRRFKARLVSIEPESAKFLTATGLVKLPIRNLMQTEGERALRAWPEDFGKISEMSLPDSDIPAQQEFLKEFPLRHLLWEMGEKPLPKMHGAPTTPKLPMLYHVPETGDKRGKLPLIVHLHGMGGLGPDIRDIIFKDAHGVAIQYFDKRLQSTNPCCLLFPHSRGMESWGWGNPDEAPFNLKFLASAIMTLIREPNSRIDPSRIYIIGLSLGGHGVVQAMSNFPDFFAAGISISYVEHTGVFHPHSFRKNNFWMVVNRGDEGNPEELARQVLKDIRAKGGEAKLTMVDADGHNAWSRFLGGREYRTWLFARTLDHP